MLSNKYMLKMEFATNLGRTAAVTVPGARSNITDAQAAEAMQRMLDTGIVKMTSGRIVAKESATLITAITKDFNI
jgi:hypothetical protein